MKFVQQSMKVGQPGKSLKFMLHKHLRGPRPDRSIQKVHASDLIEASDGWKSVEFCARQYALMQMLKVPRPDEFLDTSTRVTFRLGHLLSGAVVEWFAEMKATVGRWQCLGCGREHVFVPRPDACVQCEATRFRHREIFFQSPVSGIWGSVDLAVDFGNPKLTSVELKTIDKEKFKKLQAPLATHRWRTNLYLRLIEDAARADSRFEQFDVKKGKILYVSKGGYGCADPDLKKWGLGDKFSPFREFDVERDDASTEKMYQTATQVWNFKTGAGGMPEGICPSKTCERAAKCSVVPQCFGGMYPPGWVKPEEEQEEMAL